MIARAAAYLVLHGPVTQQERWEEVNAKEIIARFTAAGIDQYKLAADLQREATKVIHQRLERDRRVSIALRHAHWEFTDFCLVVAC